MKWLDKMTRKFAKNASCAVKTEVKKTAADLLPRVVGIGAALLGIFLFKEAMNRDEPTLTATHITTNNYFLGDSGEEIIKKMLDKEEY